MAVPEPSVSELLEALASNRADIAWSEFLEHYSGLIYQVVQLFVRDIDHRNDCFLFICEQLKYKAVQTVTIFQPAGPGSVYHMAESRGSEFVP